VEYRILHDRLIVRLSALDDDSTNDISGLCCRHADSLRVPRGWSIDDERTAVPTLFHSAQQPGGRKRRRSSAPSQAAAGEQLELTSVEATDSDGSGEQSTDAARAEPDPAPSSLPPLLERAFHGTPMRP
jgi:hypothetical protein